MEGIKNYFNGFSGIKWFFFITLVALIMAALEQQAERLYWKYGRFEPLIVEGNIKIINQRVTPGEDLFWEITYTKTMDIIPEISCQLINHIVYTITVDPPASKPLNKKQTRIHSTKIPRAADYGQYKMVRTYRYPVGPDGRVITKTVESEPFWVEPGPSMKGTKGDTGATGKQEQVGVQGIQGKTGQSFWDR